MVEIKRSIVNPKEWQYWFEADDVVKIPVSKDIWKDVELFRDYPFFFDLAIDPDRSVEEGYYDWLTSLFQQKNFADWKRGLIMYHKCFEEFLPPWLEELWKEDIENAC